MRDPRPGLKMELATRAGGERRLLLRGCLGRKGYDDVRTELNYRWSPTWRRFVLDCSRAHLGEDCGLDDLLDLCLDLERRGTRCRLLRPAVAAAPATAGLSADDSQRQAAPADIEKI